MIIFLDFDGVLHDSEVYLSNGKPELRSADPDARLFQHTGVLEEALAPYPQARLVLSTSWVPRFSFDSAKAWLPPSLSSRVRGATFHSKAISSRQTWYMLSRFYQIDMYVDRHQLADWLAIDDDAFGWPSDQWNHLVHCFDPEEGLGSLQVQLDLQAKLRQIANNSKLP